MTDPTRPDEGPETGAREMPRAVKVIGIGVAVLILVVFVGVHLLGGGGPALHGGGGGEHGEDTPPIDGAPQLAVTAADLAFDPDAIELPAGMPVNVALTSTDVFHDLVVDEVDFHLGADRGETAVGGLVFGELGTYVGYCSVPGHREAGMEFQIVVLPADDPGHRPPPWAH
jgi:nitrite reductase (NO-forming)